MFSLNNSFVIYTPNISIGATVLNATLAFKSAYDSGVLSFPQNYNIYGVLGNPSIPTNATDCKNAILTSSSIPWQINSNWSADYWYTTPDLTTILQEIISQPGYVVASNFIIQIKFVSGGLGNLFSYTYDFLPEYAPILCIEWTTGQPHIIRTLLQGQRVLHLELIGDRILSQDELIELIGEI